MTPAPGQTVAGCTLVAECGRGAYGCVWLATDALGRRVAVKCLNTVDASEYELRGLRNYMAIAGPHPGLLQVFHAGVEDGVLVYVMEAADNANPKGEAYAPDTLGLRLKRRGRLSVAEALRLLHELLDGLEAMHAAGMLHRDIKPENIIYVDGHPRLADPGLARNLAETMSVAGTPGYIPPEFLYRGVKLTPAADIYALGKLLYHVVTGNPPEAYPALPTTVPLEDLDPVWLALAKWCDLKPERRCQSCAECRKVLPRTVESRGPLRRLWDAFRWRPAFRRRVLLWLGAAMAVLMALAGTAAAVLLRCRAAAKARNEAQAAAARRLESVQASLSEWEERWRAWEQQRAFFGVEELRSDLAAARALLAAGRSAEAEAALARFLEEARRAVRRRMPSGTAGDLSANGLGWSYLSAPLVQALVPSEERAALAGRLEAEAARLMPLGPRPGFAFAPEAAASANFEFVPPGQFLSPTTGTVRRIDYPYWILGVEVSGALYSQYTRSPLKTLAPAQAMECLTWNDALRFCRSLQSNIFGWRAPPPGYGLRIPTEEEWEFAALGGWANRLPPPRDIPRGTANRTPGQGEANPLGLRDLDDNVSELVEPYAEKPLWAPEVAAMRGASYHERKSGVLTRFPYMRDQCHRQGGGGLRLVLAPMPLDYYGKSWWRGPEIRRAEVDGAVYAGFAVVLAACRWLEAQALAENLGAALPETLDKAMVSRLNDALALPPGFPWPLGIRANDGQWRRLSDGAPVEVPGAAADASRDCLAASTRAFAAIPATASSPTLVLRWPSKEAFERRQAVFLERACLARFELDGRRFALLRLRMASYAVRPFLRFVGLRQPADASLEFLRRLARRLPSDRICALGPVVHYNRFEQPDGSPLPLAVQDVPALQDYLVSEGLLGLAASKGELRRCAVVDAALVELDAPPSARDGL